MSDIHKAQGFITVVHGYHACTPVPSLAYKEGLNHRYAVVFETDFPESDDMIFQAECFIALMTEIEGKFECDALEIEVDEKVKYSSIRMLDLSLSQHDLSDSMPPRRILFRKNNHLLCIAETEFWAMCGGPYPYHDAYTAAFYTKENMNDTFDDVCSGLNIVIRDRIKGYSKPKEHFWRKCFRALTNVGLFRV